MKILVTGASGFIGKFFCKQALAAGHSVAGLSRGTHHRCGNIYWINCDITQPDWKKINAFKPDTLVHLAWITTPGEYLDSPVNASMLQSSSNFIDKLTLENVDTVICAGTCMEYEVTGEILTENHSRTAINKYAESKIRLHNLLIDDSINKGYRFVWGRIFHPYGSGEHPSRLCSSIIRTIISNREFFIKTPNSVKDYIHIDDLVTAMTLTIESDFAGSINWGTGLGVSIIELARNISSELGKENLISTSGYNPNCDKDIVVADATLLKNLGWKQNVSLNDGVRGMIKDFSPNDTAT